ncbi:hypothetical protein BJ912DRAFT_1143207 [Pholiota molesta]|nr:hypothetical protein BJ912DRAFT_1143207 [Pholiota molesta]
MSSLHSTLVEITAAYQWPDPQYEVLERLLYEGTDIDDNPFTILTNSCGKRAEDLSPVVAEWLRLSYHDSGRSHRRGRERQHPAALHHVVLVRRARAQPNCPGSTASFTTIAHPTSFNHILVSPVMHALQTGPGQLGPEPTTTPGAGAVQDNGGQLNAALATVQAYDNTFRSAPSAPFTTTASLVPVASSRNYTLAALPPTLLNYTLYTARFTTPLSTAGRPMVDIAVEGNVVAHAVDFARPLPVGAAVGAAASTTVAGVPTAGRARSSDWKEETSRIEPNTSVRIDDGSVACERNWFIALDDDLSTKSPRNLGKIAIAG